MKQLYLLAILFSVSHFCIGQTDMGTIEVNNVNTATLKFSSDIQTVIFGNNPILGAYEDNRPKFQFYDNYSSGKTDVIKLNDNSAPESSITIILDNENSDVFFGTLKIGTNPKIFYNFSNINSKKNQAETKQLKDSLNKKLEITRVEERLKFVMAKEIEYNDLGVAKDRLEVSIANIMNDDKNTYIKFIIKNNSGSDYNIDNVIFKYIEGKKKGLKNKEAQIEERINPIVEPDKNIIKAYSSSDLGYVIPLFTVSESGVLIIQMIEKNGTRNPQIKIESKTMLKVKSLK
jgi:hypothetical protein